DIDNPIDHQEGIAVRQRHENRVDLHAGEFPSLPGRILTERPQTLSPFASRLIAAISRFHILTSCAGAPAILEPGGKLWVIPERSRMREFAPMRRSPALPTLPPITTPSSRMVEPLSPHMPEITQLRPIWQLWPIWTRLSILEPSPITVSPSVPRSTVL